MRNDNVSLFVSAAARTPGVPLLVAGRTANVRRMGGGRGFRGLSEPRLAIPEMSLAGCEVPDVTPFPLAVRIAIIGGLAVSSWGAVIGVAVSLVRYFG